jgi:phospholipid/cholesterol/gamma-HCH transport system permease protein
MKVISNIGKYLLMMRVVFSRPEKFKLFRKRVFNEIEVIGINSIPIVALMSTFMGAVIALQTASNISSPLLPDYTVGFITQSSTILEFSPTIISLILAGKVGSNVASEIGTRCNFLLSNTGDFLHGTEFDWWMVIANINRFIDN